MSEQAPHSQAELQPADGRSELPPAGPLSLGELLERNVRLYRARFRPFVLTVVVLVGPFTLVGSLLVGSILGNYVQTLEQLLVNPPESAFDALAFLMDEFGLLYGGMLLLSLASAAAQAIVTLSLTAQSIGALHDRPLPFGAGIGRGLRRFWAYAGMSVVKWATIFAVVIAGFLPLILSIAVLLAAGALVGGNWLGHAGEEGGILAGVGAVALVVCGYFLGILLSLVFNIYFSARWLVAPAALVAEDAGPVASLRRSWRLTRGNVLRVTGYFILLYIVMAVFLYVPSALLQWVIFLTWSTDALVLVVTVSSVFSSFLYMLGLPFYVGAIVLLYYDLRLRAQSGTSGPDAAGPVEGAPPVEKREAGPQS